MIGKSRRQAVDLPWDIICNIDARLPLKSLVRFKTVSKRWDDLTRDAYIVESHSNNPPSNCFILSRKSGFGGDLFLVDKKNQEWTMTAEIVPHPILQAIPFLEIVATCNGLMCLSDLYRKKIIIYNPITREIRDTPKLRYYNDKYLRKVYFVHDAKTKKYKLLVLVSLVFYAITIGETSWRKLDIPPAYTSEVIGRPIITPNGEICWITVMLSNKLQILFMDIHDEKFRVTKIPDVICEEKVYYQHYYLFVCDNHITLFAINLLPEQGLGREVQVWKLMDSKQETWVRQPTQNKVFSQDVEVVSTVGADGLLLKLWNGWFVWPKMPSSFVIYNPESGNVSKIVSPDDPEIYNLISFTPSLVSLKDFE